jgi:nucleotide-binding universal stress UspA family protein
VSEAARKEQILVLVDDSEGSKAAASIALQVARGLSRPLAILGVSSRREQDALIASAVAGVQERARETVAGVEAIQSTGEILDVALRRVSETPTALVVLGSNPRRGELRQAVAARVWRLVKSLPPPVMVVPARWEAIRRVLFCTGGERFIEEGARFTASICAALSAHATVFHVSPSVPQIYGGQFPREAESPEVFLASNSRLARNVRRQVEIFRSAGVETDFHVAGGDVLAAVLGELRRSGADLLVVGSPASHRTIPVSVLGDIAREIAGRSGRPFLVVRSRLRGFWSELWRALTQRPVSAEASEPSRADGLD